MLSRKLLWAVSAVAVLASCSDSREADVVLAGPNSAAPGQMITLNVTINDKTGLLYDSYLGKVTFSSDDDSAQLPAPYSFKKDDKGKHAFVVSFSKLGVKTLNARSETSTGTLTITIANPLQPKAMSLEVKGLADPSTAGAQQDLDVTAVDAMGNPVVGYTGTVGFASTDAQAHVPAPYTFTAADQGHHVFPQGVSLKTSGMQSVTATDQMDMMVTGSQTVTVNAGPAASFDLSGFPNPTTAGVAGTATLTVKDQFGNLASGYTGTVHLSSSDAQATLGADYTFVAADNGSHGFSATLSTAGTQSLTATDQAKASLTATQSGIVVNAGPAASLTVANYPSPQPAGMGGSFDVSTFDAFGNPATGYLGTIHFTSTDPAAMLPADYTFLPADQGRHTFSATFTQIGVQSLTATDAAMASLSGTQTMISITPAGVAAIALTGFPTPQTAGVPGNFTVAVSDAFGNPALNYSGTVHFTSTDPLAVLPPDYTFTAADMGSHVFSGTLATAGTQSLTATDTFTPALNASETNIVVTPGTAASLAVAGYPSPNVAGMPGNFLVTALDAFGNIATGYAGTIHVTLSDPFATPPADYTFTAADLGVHMASATFKSAGVQSLAAVDMTNALSASQANIVIVPGPAAMLTLNGFPSPTVAGTAGTFIVTAFDAYSNVATGYAGTIHFTSSDSQATLPANYTFTAADNGAHTFGATLKTVGTQSLVGTDTATATLVGTQGGIVVNPSSGVSFTLTGFPSPVTAGTSGSMTLTVRDPFGNLATGYVGTAHFTSTDPQAILPADYTFTAGDAGQHTFTATLDTAGTQSISVGDGGGASSTQANITVNPAAAATMTLAGFPSPQTAGVAGTFTVTLKDTYGNLATGYRGTMHFGSTDTSAALPADYVFTAADAATHSFSATLKTAGTQTLTGSDVSAGLGASQPNITIVPAAAATLTVSGFPSPTTAGTAGNATVTVKDAFGNLASGYRGTVHFSSTDAAATLPADYTFTAGDSGAHAFSLTFKTTGTFTLGAADTVTATIAGSQTGIVVQPAAATTFTVAGFPSPQTAGVAGTFTVTAKDAFGNLASGYRGTVHLTSSDAAATLSADYAFTAGDNGSHVFSATLRTAATQTLTATDAVQPSITGAQTGIVVRPAAATTLVVAGFPSPQTAGVAGTFTATARDSFGNLATGYRGTVHVSSTDGAATLPADYAFTAGDNGVHSFSATLKTAGTQSLTGTDTVTALISGTQSGIVINPAAGASVTVAGFPSPQTAGVAGNVTVTVKDAFGNIATGYRGTMHFTSTDGAATLSPDYTFTAGDNGVRVFSATLRTVGTRALTATDTTNGALTATQSGIVVNPAAASTFTVSGFPSPTTAGVAGNVTVSAYDPFGNVATGYRGAAHFTSTDGAATLPADYAFTAADNGTHVFSATLKTAGTRALTATDTVTATITGTQNNITVNPAAAASLTAAGFPSPTTAGAPGSLTVSLFDAFGNAATGYLGTVHFTSSDPAAALPANYAFTAADNGVHVFAATLKTVGTQSLTATDTVTATLTGSQTNITVNPASASAVTVAGFPSPQTAGVSGTFTVTVKDAFGNLATGYRGTMHFASTDGAATLPADYTFTAGDNGAHTFSATLRTSGSRALTATDTVTATLTGTQSPITVNPAAATTLTVAGFPDPQTAGVAGTVTVTAKDAFGNTASGYLGTVHFTATDASATLPANYAFTAGDAGAHVFSVTLKTAGLQTTTATDTVNAAITGSQTVTVNPAAASTLVVAGFPSPQNAGVAGGFTVTVRDPFGNLATQYRGTVHLSSTDGAATLPANYTFTAADSATHSFTATFATVGTQSLTATDTVTTTITGSQTSIVVNPASGTILVVAGFPSPQVAGVAGTFSITVKDSFGNIATGYTGTLHFTSTDGAATLPANYTFTAADVGVHNFSATLKTVGTRVITATDTVSPGINGAQGGIVITPAAAASFTVSGFPSPQTAGVSGAFTVTARDAFGNTATGYLGTAHFTSGDGAAALPANYTFTAGDSGAHSFSATLKTAGTQSLTSTDTVSAGITGSQVGITVNPAAAATLVVAGFPNPATAGSSGAFTVTARDAFGNTATGYRGTAHFTSSDGAATLPSDYAFTAADNGVHSFNATMKTVGTQTLTGTDTVTVSITGTQSGIVVNPAGAATFTVVGYPSPSTAGVAGNLTVTAKDAFGNVATGYRGAAHFTSSDAQAALPANYTFTAADNGVHVFSATLKTAGTQSLTATDTVTASITGTQSGIVVNPAAAASFTVAGFTSPHTAGVAGAFTVTAHDAFGNLATGYLGTVHFTSSDGAATLPANYAFGAGDAGVHSFSATLKTAGTQSLTATDTVTASITGTQSGIVINPAAAATFTVAGLTTPRTAGTAGTLTVTAHDAFGNVATGYTGTAHFSSTDAQATLPADYAFTAGDAGTHSFSVTLKTVGTQSVTATDTVTVTITGTQSGIVVNPAGASTFSVSGLTTPRTAGVVGNITVTAKDAFGNTATSYLGTARFTSTDAQAALPANYTFTAADAGQHVFSVTLKTAGTQTVSATDTVTATLTGSQTGIVVNPAAVSTLNVAGFPNPATAGNAGAFTVTASDPFGNTVTGYTGTVHFSSSDTSATLPANYVFTAADSGSHSFSATLRRSGAQSLTATDTSNGALTGTQNFTVNPAAASSFTVSGYPSPDTAGTVANATVVAFDPFFNVATGYRGTVRFTSTDAQAALPANYTFTAGDNGQHVFSLTLKTAGTQSITAIDTVTSTLTGTQSGILVVPGAPDASKSTISCSPNRVLADNATTIACNVHFQDLYGNPLSGATVAWSPSCYSYGSGTYVTCSSETFTGGTSTTLDSAGNGSNAMRSSLAQLKYINALVAGVTKSALVFYLPTVLPHSVASYQPFNNNPSLSSLGFVTTLPGYALARVSLANASTFALTYDYYETTASGATGIAQAYNQGEQWAVAGQTSSTVSWWNASGTLTTLTPQTAPMDATFGDVNSDGYPDLVVANRDSNTVSLFFGNSSATYGTPINFPVGTRPRSVNVGYRPDGKGFIAVANEGSDTVSFIVPSLFCSLACFWTNAGFTYTLSAGSHPMAVLYTGSSQVAVAEAGLDRVEVLSVTSTNTASVAQTLGTGFVPVSLTMGTNYNNGYTYFLGVGNYVNASASVFSSTTTSSWSSYATYSFGTEVGNVLLADADGDCGDELFYVGPDGWSAMSIVHFVTGFCPIF